MIQTKPPKKFRHYEYHWLKSERSLSPGLAAWHSKKGVWIGIGEKDNILPEEMYRRGWEYLMPVCPPVLE